VAEVSSFVRPIRLAGLSNPPTRHLNEAATPLTIDRQDSKSECPPVERQGTSENSPVKARRLTTSKANGKQQVLQPTRPKVSMSVQAQLRTYVEPHPCQKPPRRYVDWKPYTISDFKERHSASYKPLGGLGPYNIGTEEWTAAKELSDKRRSYGKLV
jgi:hypothetical protein